MKWTGSIYVWCACMIKIFPVPAFNDNYIWIGVNAEKQAFVVDPGDAAPALNFLEKNQLSLSDILITHKHHDHTGGISALLSVFSDVSVFSHPAEQVTQTTQLVSGNDLFRVNECEFQVIDIPGHTLGHVAYYCKPFLFCGDTLFTNGCGRIFEGTAEQMFSSLEKLMALPDDTQIYCGHEYTLSNITFALAVEPNNAALKTRYDVVRQLRAQNKPTVPSTLALERETNPFLRCHQSTVIEAASKNAGKKLINEIDVFAELRRWKNTF